MIKLTTLKDQAVGVFGLGATGLSTITALIESGADVWAWDENPRIRERVAEMGVTLTPPKEWKWDELVALVPGMDQRVSFPLDHKILKKAFVAKVPVMSDIELFAREVATLPEEERPRIVGVAGSNGKTFTARLIAHMIADVGDVSDVTTNKSEPLLSLSPISADKTYVIELPTRKLAWTRSLSCDVAILLNATPVTAPQLESAETLVRLMTRVFRNQGPLQLSVIGTDDVYGQKICTALMARARKQPQTTGHIVPVSGEATVGEGVFCLANRAFHAENGKTNALGSFERAPAIIGQHLNQNAAAALASGATLGLVPAQMIRAIHSFDGINGVLRYLGDQGAVRFYDDSSASDIMASLKSLSVGTPLFWIGGGEAQRQIFTKLREKAPSLSGAYFFGDAANDMKEALGGACPVTCFDSHLEAIRAAIIDATKTSQLDPTTSVNVLFSPGCPIRFKGGDRVFAELVSRFLEGNAA